VKFSMLRNSFERVYSEGVPHQCEVLDIWFGGGAEPKSVILQGPTMANKSSVNFVHVSNFLELSATPHIPCRYPVSQVLLFSQW
jgi:hypothetical protein